MMSSANSRPNEETPACEFENALYGLVHPECLMPVLPFEDACLHPPHKSPQPSHRVELVS